MILVAESRSVDMKYVLAPLWDHCHGHWSMQMGPYEKQIRPHLPGSLRKMYLLQKLSQLHQPVSLVGWVWYKLMNSNNKTFAQLAASVLSIALCVSGQNVVFDVYRQPSIKYSERLDRGASTLVFQNI